MRSEDICEAIDGLAQAVHHVARSIEALGNANASTPMGAIEALGKAHMDAMETIAEAIRSIADAAET